MGSPSDASGYTSDKHEKIIPSFIDKGKTVSLLIAFFFGLFSLPYAINRTESTNIELVFYIGMVGVAGLASLLLLFYLRRPYYLKIKPFQGSFPQPFANEKRKFRTGDYEYYENPSKCKLCERHPVNKKYHLFNVHNMNKSVKVSDYFITCGCDKCLRMIDFSVPSA